MSKSTKQTLMKSLTSARLFTSVSHSLVLRNPTLLAVSLSVFAAYTGIGMVGPVRVLYAESRGASLAIIGAMASAYLISNFAFQYPLGWLADRWGRKPLMISGLLVEAALSAIYLLVSDPVTFVVLRFFEGIAAAALLPSARALINDSVSPEQQGEAYGTFSAFFNGGFLLGPGIGGLVASLGYTIPFLGAVLFRLLAVVLVITMIHVPRQNKRAGEQQPRVRPSLHQLFSLPLVGAYLIAFGDYLYLGFDLTLMPLWMHNNLGASVVIIGVFYMLWAVPNMLLSPFGGRVADKKRRSTLIFFFGLIQVPIYIIYGLANTWILVLCFITLHGSVYAFIQPAVDANVAAASASAIRARVQGLYSTAGLVGAFIGNSGFGSLYAINFHLPLLVIGIAYGICVLIGGLLIRTAERREFRLLTR